MTNLIEEAAKAMAAVDDNDPAILVHIERPKAAARAILSAPPSDAEVEAAILTHMVSVPDGRGSKMRAAITAFLEQRKKECGL